MQLTGNSLGRRQQELNNKVNEAASTNTDFDAVKAQDEADDLDKLFKIDLASKYKNVDYIIDVLKSGDSLYIARALKCIWLYGDEYSNFINPDYLQQNVIPFMSLKMKQKMLTNISKHVKNESRAASFYTYCVSDLRCIANKFLIFTSETFKLNLIKNDIGALKNLPSSKDYLKHFIGNSFDLAEAYVDSTIEKQYIDFDAAKLYGYERDEHKKNINILNSLRYLYFISDDKYLDMLEKYSNVIIVKSYFFKRFGLRISKDIMKKHKRRVIDHLQLYIGVVNKNIFVKYTTVEEAKQYAVQLLPDKSSTFWDMNFNKTSFLSVMISIIPTEERLAFLKKLFTEKYPAEPFEMSLEFYKCGYYELMSVDEREAWALRHIESKKELLGVDKDYYWYRFVNFDKAFIELKKYILVTPVSTKRENILNVLAKSARNQHDLERVLNYYYKRHVNENVYDKYNFLCTVRKDHNVYDFGEGCWSVLDKLLYSIDVHKNELRAISLFYHIIHEKDFPQYLHDFMKDDLVDFYYFKLELQSVKKEKQLMIYDYFLKFFVEKIRQYENQTYDDTVQLKVRNDIKFVLELLEFFGKKDECPDIVTKYLKLDSYFNDNKAEEQIKEADLLRHLKQNANLVVNDLDVILKRDEKHLGLNQLLKKLKIYFSNDVAQQCLELFKQLLLSPRLWLWPAYNAVYGIFQLADENTKRNFITTYRPSNPKIEHGKIDEKYLCIQEAICRVVCYSRPPVPGHMIRSYINGDYLKYCLPMFNVYSSNLPLHLCKEFVESLLDAPVSVQKHGLRMAFNCFSFERLKTLVQEAWKKSKNLSLRMVIYTRLHNHVIKNDDETQIELFELLKSLTLDLNDEDHEDVLELISESRLIPEKLRGKYLETVWETVTKFPENQKNVDRMVGVVRDIENNYKLLDKVFLQNIINEHIHAMLTEKRILSKDKKYFKNLEQAKWHLAATYFTRLNVDEENQKWILELLKFIIHKFIEMWKEDHTIVRQFCFEFIHYLVSINFGDGKDKCPKNIHIFESILSDLQNSLPPYEIYMTVWSLRLSIIAMKALRKNCREDIVSKYGREVAKLVRESVDSKTFSSAFYSNILQAIDKTLLDVIDNVSRDEISHNVRPLVGIELVEFGILETQLLATEMLCFCNDCLSDGNSYSIKLLRKLKNIPNNEVKSLLYQKYADSYYIPEIAKILFE